MPGADLWTRVLAIGVALAALAAGCVSAEATARRDRTAKFERSRRAIERGRTKEKIARRRGPRDPEAPALEALRRRVRAVAKPVAGRRELGRFFGALDALDERLLALEALDLRIRRLREEIRRGQDRDRNTIEMQRLYGRRQTLEANAAARSVRVLHLGDSHIAADYVTRTVRSRLQARFGNGGRGFVAADQKAVYGGRRLRRRGWRRTRLADRNASGEALGVAGVELESVRRGANLHYLLEPPDRQVVLHYLAHPTGPALELTADGFELGHIPTRAEADEVRALRVGIDLPPPPPTSLVIQASGPEARVLGVSFETGMAGILYDAVGPVGADARAWLSVKAHSFSEELAILAPHLVILMLGGNDALAVRQDRRSLEDVDRDLTALIERTRAAAPETDCLLFGPMDAAVRRPSGKLDSRAFIQELVEVERAVAERQGCAFWDAFSAMGGQGSFARWLEAGLMNRDLVHPRSRGGDLLGHLFARALIEAYLDG